MEKNEFIEEKRIWLFQEKKLDKCPKDTDAPA